MIHQEQPVSLNRLHHKKLRLECEGLQILVPAVEAVGGSRGEELGGVVEVVLVELLGLLLGELDYDDVVVVVVLVLGLHL